MRIDFLCNDGSPIGVTPADIYGRGVGGAELALMTLAETLASRGHEITIYNDPTSPGNFDGVTYSAKGLYNQRAKRDALVVFRSPSPLLPGSTAGRKIWWSTDQYTIGSFSALAALVDFCVTISPYHTNYHVRTYGVDPAKIGHIDLGVRISDYEQEVSKIKNRLIYCSIPDRGLTILHAAFPLIQREVPDVTLVITSDYTLWGVDARDMKHRLNWAGMKGVEYVGKIDRRELVKRQLEAEIMSYPCTYEELFCATPDTIVETAAGALPISMVPEGESIRDGDGILAPTTAMYRWIGEHSIQTIRTLGNNEAIKVTSGHRLMALKASEATCRPLAPRVARRLKITHEECKPGWVRADQLERGDVLLVPFRTEVNIPPSIRIAEVVDSVIEVDEKTWQVYNHVGRPAFRETRIPPVMPINKQFARLLGYYVAEGSTSRGAVQFSLALRERETLAVEIETALVRVTGLSARVYPKGKAGLQLHVSSTPLARLFEGLCGHGARSKRFPEWAMTMPIELQTEMLRAYLLGDGNVYKSPEKNSLRLSATTASRTLAYQIRELFARQCIAASLKLRKDNGTFNVAAFGEQLAVLAQPLGFSLKNGRNSAKNIWIDGGFLHLPVVSCVQSRFLGTVYDVSVPSTASYRSSGFLSHNCVSAAECQVAGALPVTTAIGALETTNQFGIKVSGDLHNPAMLQSQFVDRIVGLLTAERDYMEKKATAMRAASKVRFDWNVIAERWEGLISDGRLPR